MQPTRRRVLASTAAAITLAGCLGGGGGETTDGTTTATTQEQPTSTTTTETTTTESGGVTVQVRDHPDLGPILTDSAGMTLYMFDNDAQGSGASSCSGGCLNAWPPLTVDGDPTVGDGVGAELTTFDREDGSTQVAADGWPLYYYASDQAPGDVAGQGIGGVWWVLGPDGTPKRPDQETTTTTDAGQVTVQVRDHPDHGEILTDSEGMTLYMFDNDAQGSGASSCSGGCAQNWPPLTAEGEPSAGDGVGAELTTFQRSGGETQVAAGGWPLYYFASDESPGDANGQGVGDVWWVLEPDGSPIRGGSGMTTTDDGDGMDDGDGDY